ncbi:unnamed protein product [Rangifer tarandus platyrhynchus]|uniref:Uncharacterized protein n=2 Tax=Rangifer tarandus platyrhynchus TaxID=3082113 RepID=A0AC59YVW3_RANTA|nr:unnamed protein product [Rangifer tarandus platyrhynchus]
MKLLTPAHKAWCPLFCVSNPSPRPLGSYRPRLLAILKPQPLSPRAFAHALSSAWNPSAHICSLMGGSPLLLELSSNFSFSEKPKCPSFRKTTTTTTNECTVTIACFLLVCLSH